MTLIKAVKGKKLSPLEKKLNTLIKYRAHIQKIVEALYNTDKFLSSYDAKNNVTKQKLMPFYSIGKNTKELSYDVLMWANKVENEISDKYKKVKGLMDEREVVEKEYV